MSNTYLLVTDKPWHDKLYLELAKREEEKWIRIRNKEEFTSAYIRQLDPQKIFIPHWSFIIENDIYNNFECIVFHITDLPFGRGGSPLQNLIVRGYSESKISAINVSKGIDTGDIYFKEPIQLYGTAEEIFIRTAQVIQGMIIKLITEKIVPTPQTGEVVEFKRRKPGEGNVSELSDIEKFYDYIRMLDAQGYPPAFLETEHFRLEFTHASLQSNDSIIADVRITKK